MIYVKDILLIEFSLSNNSRELQTCGRKWKKYRNLYFQTKNLNCVSKPSNSIKMNEH